MYNLIKFIKIINTSYPQPSPLGCKNKTVNCQNCQISQNIPNHFLMIYAS